MIHSCAFCDVILCFVCRNAVTVIVTATTVPCHIFAVFMLFLDAFLFLML
jgi:hypothetical protein